MPLSYSLPFSSSLCFCFFSLFLSTLRSMSLTCSSFPLHVPVSTSVPLVKHANKILMLKQNQVPAGKKAPILQIRSLISKNKVFEDQSQGVICYRDENGEIVCEGYDEGPRFFPATFYNLRDAEILDLLQERWLEIVNGGGFSHANESVFIVQDDSNSNSNSNSKRE